MLLVLDLDETLIHAREAPLERAADFELMGYHVYVRPHLERFLTECAARFRLAVWSSASDDYVEAIASRIFPSAQRPELVWGRSRCTYAVDCARVQEEGFMDPSRHCAYVKKLGKLKRRGFRLERVLIVDDTPAKCAFNYGNAIYVRPFEGAREDAELPVLSRYLGTLADVPDVRRLEKRGWWRSGA
ncbi:phosphoprotein phosphatase [Myxococcus stipitatus DSM 14675]|uniref:Phosphoprotein phosphatase n=1 Tax=Myxococcus stipitatus (strain DSM 14675 / JCM 12634 / Mx s8) TaxID=1278073 RepID=L7ULG5_MYXSD|nr:HAD family hydrolase [Myxococcus stipitatus]AGC48367.1 phosphoprotein phosphatase [Myxococcus stipitatus DSM 14675]